MNQPMVSIICTTYNHAPYIASALDSFLMQKTAFPFEVIVHDDCSTDGTTEIVRQYAARYPDIIRPIFEEINQYSQGKSFFASKMLPMARGKYLATCEGDDYWTDACKLERQVAFLESHPEYIVCGHNTVLETPNGRRGRVMHAAQDADWDLSDVVMSGANCFHTSSRVYRHEYALHQPPFVTMIPLVGDYPQAIYFALCGKMKYFGDVMSAYRLGTNGSWTNREFSTVEQRVRNKRYCIDMLKAANEWADFRYDAVFKKAILFSEYSILSFQGRYKEMLQDPYRQFSGRPKEWLKIQLKRYFPFAVKIIRFIRIG